MRPAARSGSGEGGANSNSVAHASYKLGALHALGQDVAARCGLQPPAATEAGQSKQEHALEQLFVEVSRERPVVVKVDDIDYADDASVGMLAALANACTQHAVTIVVSELELPSKSIGLALAALQARSSALQFGAFSQKLRHTRSCPRRSNPTYSPVILRRSCGHESRGHSSTDTRAYLGPSFCSHANAKIVRPRKEGLRG